MTIESFLAIACLIFAAVGAIVYWFANKHMFVRNRRKRYVRAPRKACCEGGKRREL